MTENTAVGSLAFELNRGAAHLADYTRLRATGGIEIAQKRLLDSLADKPAADWLDCGRALVLRGDAAVAAAVLSAAVVAHPELAELRHALAGALWQTKRYADAEAVFRELIARDPADVAATFQLARLYKEQARMLAAETVLCSLFARSRQRIDVVIQAVELLDDCDRKRAAAELCESEIAAGSRDPRLHAYAGMLDTQVGDFARARERYLFALANDPRALEWQSAYGLASLQRYARNDDPDFELFRGFLERPALSGKARASLLFALGKAYDDVGAYAQAAECFREANAIVGAAVAWSRKPWRRLVSARLERTRTTHRVEATDDFRPVFIVGAPRSGTTLTAELLARHPNVCNRGELGWLAFLAQGLARGNADADALAAAAAAYRTQVRQDDTSARWFIDKQPLNFLHLGLIATLFPNAKVVYCVRNSRDTALSIWMQYFAGAEQGFAYDFANIAAMMQGCVRLVASAQALGDLSIRTVRYEELAQDAEGCIRALSAWLGLPDVDVAGANGEKTVISTSSAWQARQPVYTRSIGRWRAYAPHAPELLDLPDD